MWTVELIYFLYICVNGCTCISEGCYPQPTQSTSYNISLSPNTVGRCFSHCKAHSGKNCTYFALQGDQCFCPCSFPNQNLADSNKCNVTCNNSTDDGYCGGIGHITLYEVRDEHLYRGDGFCLAHNCAPHKRVYFGEDCDEQFEGFCVTGASGFEIQSRNTWNGYSVACKKQNYFMTAHIESSGALQCTNYAWSGDRSYQILNVEENQSCYKITLELGIFMYKKANCSDKIPSVCRTQSPYTTVTPNTAQSVSTAIEGPNTTVVPNTQQFVNTTYEGPNTTIISNTKQPANTINGGPYMTVIPNTQQSVNTIDEGPNMTAIPNTEQSVNTIHEGPNTTVIPNTEQSVNTTDEAVGLVVGLVMGAVILLTATLLTFCIVRKKRKAKNRKPPTIHNVLYDISETGHTVGGQKDAIYMNGGGNHTNSSTQFPSQDADGIYIERPEGEYDRLHTSCPKTCINEESHYDTSDSAYSSTTRDEHTNKVYGSHYDSMASSQENPYDSNPNERGKMYGSHYDSMVSSQENPYDSNLNDRGKVYGSHYDSMVHVPSHENPYDSNPNERGKVYGSHYDSMVSS